jgi:hypothetical protein
MTHPSDLIRDVDPCDHGWMVGSERVHCHYCNSIVWSQAEALAKAGPTLCLVNGQLLSRNSDGTYGELHIHGLMVTP